MQRVGELRPGRRQHAGGMSRERKQDRGHHPERRDQGDAADAEEQGQALREDANQDHPPRRGGLCQENAGATGERGAECDVHGRIRPRDPWGETA